jgi:hypothetical protein
MNIFEKYNFSDKKSLVYQILETQKDNFINATNQRLEQRVVYSDFEPFRLDYYSMSRGHKHGYLLFSVYENREFESGFPVTIKSRDEIIDNVTEDNFLNELSIMMETNFVKNTVTNMFYNDVKCKFDSFLTGEYLIKKEFTY